MISDMNPAGETSGEETNLQQLRYNLFQSASWLNSNIRKFLDPFAITPKQYNILLTLESRNPESLSIQEVRESLADKMSDASRLIDRLEKKNYLEKFPSDYDRRSNRVRITEAGQKLLVQINSRREALDEVLLQRLKPEEVVQLNELLSRLK
ncbi:MarR family winged helix-turn-helix transcriptional regulator [Neolewinella agarilytica]|uniref:Transcriptional regulator, MarR family n=1 Tax=Neolewinella agarilytica TaxID=478744 RepID=A0A1H9BM84_9BACT|nr:MarR family transcriptional regulator [Neolewinella agarilytica]SEP90070.1 transcriptional regulator, MarR family [Neolewinella agarilytica]